MFITAFFDKYGEWCEKNGIAFTGIMGDFDVEMHGICAVIKEKNDKIQFGSITEQGMPFYGGNIIYSAEIDTPECSLNIRCNSYRGALVFVIIDGKEPEI